MSSKFNMTENRVGKTICALRKNKKLTQAELGKALGYSARTFPIGRMVALNLISALSKRL